MAAAAAIAAEHYKIVVDSHMEVAVAVDGHTEVAVVMTVRVVVLFQN